MKWFVSYSELPVALIIQVTSNIIKWNRRGIWTWWYHHSVIRYTTEEVDWNDFLKLRFHLKYFKFLQLSYIKPMTFWTCRCDKDTDLRLWVNTESKMGEGFETECEYGVSLQSDHLRPAPRRKILEKWKTRTIKKPRPIIRYANASAPIHLRWTLFLSVTPNCSVSFDKR
jgi:hypothetical protein